MNMIKDDFVKSVINIPRRMLTILNIYPEKQNKYTKLSFIFMLLLVSCLEMGQTVYMISNFKDMAEMASTCTTVSTNFQAICKLIILYKNLDHINAMLKIFWYKFWPVDIANGKLKSSLRFHAQLITLNMTGVFSTANAFGLEFISLPLIAGKRNLPLSSSYPFDWTQSPQYEIIYVLQALTNMLIVIISICGHDFLFISLMLNTITQFRMLKYVTRNIGNENVAGLNEKLNEWIGDEEDVIRVIKDEDINNELMRKCIRHHIKLLKFCDDLEKVFSATVFIQYVASISAICVSSFLISLIEKSSVRHLISFCIGHVFQLFLYCVVGNELVYQSREMAIAAFESQWYKTNNMQLRKNIIMVIQRSQKEKKITGLGFTDLNFESFVKVLKLSFSFHTLLNSINEK